MSHTASQQPEWTISVAKLMCWLVGGLNAPPRMAMRFLLSPADDSSSEFLFRVKKRSKVGWRLMETFLLYKDETGLKIEALNMQNTELFGQCEGLREKCRQLESTVRARDSTIQSLQTTLMSSRGDREEVGHLKAALEKSRAVEGQLRADIDRLSSMLAAEQRIIKGEVDGSFNDMSAMLVQLQDDTAAKLYQQKADELRKQYVEICGKYEELSDKCMQQESLSRAEKSVLEEELKNVRRHDSELQSEVDRLLVVASHLEIEKVRISEERDGIDGAFMKRSLEAEAKLEELSLVHTELLGTTEALREKCRQLESTLVLKESTVLSLQKMIASIETGSNADMTRDEIKKLEEEMARVAMSGTESLQRLQVDVLRLQMAGKKVQQREIFAKIDREFDRADNDRDEKITKEEWNKAFGSQSPSERQFMKMAEADGEGLVVTKEKFRETLLQNRSPVRR